ncbi:Eco57I restriction-modification methylase domain-containing protein [Sedimentibacter sp. MB31-C6]|uniref:Eco57I restriction-modification methylase domain-containing protein n=1 Tax=Sedimentibacter sp. MB31-C6 TaxID=3109366 RepID=UPI002DDD4FAC|nr:N-6 DNA methylase [Sedimentibacter sp. MB36-C1]WSI03519.1 N-6 DNA methylase [Sedimentibacter sp. MB36-C1]
MNKKFIKDLIKIIKNIDNSDYIYNVKYIIFFVSKVMYACKLNGISILEENLSDLLSKYVLNNSSMGIFDMYDKYNLNESYIEERIYILIKENKDYIFINDFSPASLYESLLTSKEKKLLGQVYTPKYIVIKMLNNVFNIKTINKDTKILDPSCGGGYFLIEAFKLIKERSNFNDKYIIENMLHGVDIDEFSIFLTKIGILFICNSTNVKFNIVKKDFLIEIYEINNYDIIIGNPPYIGHKNTDKEYRAILRNMFKEVFYDKSDISYCFFMKCKDYLKNDGVLSFITSRYFMEAMYADKLRYFIKNNYSILSIVDYSGIRIFKNVMVSPAVITLSNIVMNKNEFYYVKYNRDNIEKKFNYNQDKLKSHGWIILESIEEELFNRIESIGNAYIRDICNIKQGIITGFDKAFIVDEETIEKHKLEKYLLKKWVKNSNITKSKVTYNNKYLIYTNLIENEKDFPNTLKYLAPHKERLMTRRECMSGLRKWYELQWGRNHSDFEKPKIIFPYKSRSNRFYFDKDGYFCSADVYLINEVNDDISFKYLLEYLNSSVFEFYFKCLSKKVGKELYEYYPNKLNNVKIYIPPDNIRNNISNLGKISIDIYLKKVFNITEEEVNTIINKYI